MAITTPTLIRNRIQAAEAEFSDDVVNEFIAEQTSRRSSNRMSRKRSAESDPQIGLARSAPTDVQPRP
jgi:hypothetical protein